MVMEMLSILPRSQELKFCYQLQFRAISRTHVSYHTQLPFRTIPRTLVSYHTQTPVWQWSYSFEGNTGNIFQRPLIELFDYFQLQSYNWTGEKKTNEPFLFIIDEIYTRYWISRSDCLVGWLVGWLVCGLWIYDLSTLASQCYGGNLIVMYYHPRKTIRWPKFMPWISLWLVGCLVVWFCGWLDFMAYRQL